MEQSPLGPAEGGWGAEAPSPSSPASARTARPPTKRRSASSCEDEDGGGGETAVARVMIKPPTATDWGGGEEGFGSGLTWMLGSSVCGIL